MKFQNLDIFALRLVKVKDRQISYGHGLLVGWLGPLIYFPSILKFFGETLLGLLKQVVIPIVLFVGMWTLVLFFFLFIAPLSSLLGGLDVKQESHSS